MGGNVFPVGTTRRFDVAEYFDLSSEVIEMVSREDNQWYRYEVIPAYREKESFGDMDILYATLDNRPFDTRVFGKIFDTKHVSRNGEVTSIAYKELQIDFIHINIPQFDYALAYYNFNDFGNLVGKIAHKFGLKHGHRGLYLPLRDGDNKFDEVLITIDHNKTLEFLGLDSKRFEAGFDNLDQIFNFIASSGHYNPEFYKLENLNSIAKIRDRKRDTYRKFLEFGKTYTGSVSVGFVDKDEYLQQIFEFFPEALPEYKSKLDSLAVQKHVKTKFNGEIVKSYTGLSDKALGAFMKKLKSDWNFTQENLIYFSDEKIKSNIMKLFTSLS